MKMTLLSGLFVLALGSAASAQTLIEVDAGGTKVMADAATGMTVYTFRKDVAKTSNCYDECAKKWPPFMAADEDASDGALAVIERKDGTYQWALDGKPLYFWAGDAAKGDATGDGVGGVWDAVRPKG